MFGDAAEAEAADEDGGAVLKFGDAASCPEEECTASRSDVVGRARREKF
jgi:hypothetical protein